MNHQQVLALVKTVVADLFQLKNLEQEVQEETIIFGADSPIDSLDLVNIIVRIEEEINSQLGVEITVVDEQSLITGDTPFRTVGSLTALVAKKISG